MKPQIPVLYSFRRCPYAMRARMALLESGQACSLREVVLREKPGEMLAISPKATVPVLVLPDGQVIDESLDIMLWALNQNDPQNWLENRRAALSLIEHADGPFKHNLDRYKYGARFEEEDSKTHRQNGLLFLASLNDQLAETQYLNGPRLGLPDIAIFPFVRQFANTNRQWFDQQNLPELQRWLADRLESNLFVSVMNKYPQWKTGDDEVKFVV